MADSDQPLTTNFETRMFVFSEAVQNCRYAVHIVNDDNLSVPVLRSLTNSVGQMIGDDSTIVILHYVKSKVSVELTFSDGEASEELHRLTNSQGLTPFIQTTTTLYQGSKAPTGPFLTCGILTLKYDSLDDITAGDVTMIWSPGQKLVQQEYQELTHFIRLLNGGRMI